MITKIRAVMERITFFLDKCKFLKIVSPLPVKFPLTSLGFPLLIIIISIIPILYSKLSISQEFFRYLAFLGLTLLIIFFISFGIKTSRSVSKISLSLADVLLAFFIFIYGISTLFSTDKFSAILGLYGYNHGGFIFAFALILLFYFISRQQWNFNRLEIFSFAVTVGILASLFISMGEFPFSVSDYLNNTRIFGPQFHPIAYGIYLMAGFFISLSLIFLWENKITKLISGAISALILLVIISNGTRSVWLAASLALGMVFFCVWKFDLPFRNYLKQHKKQILVVVIIFLIAAAGLLRFWTRPGERVMNAFNAQKDPSVSIRLLEWQTALEIIKNNSFYLGQGPESAQFNYRLYRQAALNELKEGDLDLASVRNVYLNYAVNLGVPAAIIIIIFLGTVFTGAIRLFKNLQLAKKERRIMFLFFGAWLSLLTINLFYHYTITSGIFFWVLSAILVSKMMEAGVIPAKDFRVKIPAIINISTKILIVILVLGGIVLLIRVFNAEYIFAKGVSSKDSSESINLIKQSLILVPGDSRKLRMLGAREQRLEESLKFLKQALSFSPQDAKTYNEISSVYFKAYLRERKRYFLEEGLPYAIKAFQLYPSKELYADNAGEYYLALGELDKAEQFFRQAIALKKNFFLGFYHLGEVYKQKGEFKKAKKWYQDSLQYGGYPLFVKEKIKEMEALSEQD